jgi:truncated hemoglobin YjbI
MRIERKERPMKDVALSTHPTRLGYMTEKTQRDYIAAAIPNGVLPSDAHRMPEVIALTAPKSPSKPIQFWQLYSVLGQDPIVGIVRNFYERVFQDEDWFVSVFARVGGIGHHINTQASMWIDVMGGGPYYHGAEFRLNFHHTHNAMQLMNDRGAERWSQLMLETLDASGKEMTSDPRIRLSVNTFLSHFMGKYSQDFGFDNRSFFGETNPPFKQRINLLKLSKEAIEALSEQDLRDALKATGVDVAGYSGKQALVNKALMI